MRVRIERPDGTVITLDGIGAGEVQQLLGVVGASTPFESPRGVPAAAVEDFVNGVYVFDLQPRFQVETEPSFQGVLSRNGSGSRPRPSSGSERPFDSDRYHRLVKAIRNRRRPAEKPKAELVEGGA